VSLTPCFLGKSLPFCEDFFKKISKVSPCWDTIFGFGTMFQCSTIGTFFKKIVMSNVLQYKSKENFKHTHTHK
jgi:hypothetical protein